MDMLEVAEENPRWIAGLLGVDITDLVKAGAGFDAIASHRMTEIERRILKIEEYIVSMGGAGKP